MTPISIFPLSPSISLQFPISLPYISCIDTTNMNRSVHSLFLLIPIYLLYIFTTLSLSSPSSPSPILVLSLYIHYSIPPYPHLSHSPYKDKSPSLSPTLVLYLSFTTLSLLIPISLTLLIPSISSTLVVSLSLHYSISLLIPISLSLLTPISLPYISRFSISSLLYLPLYPHLSHSPSPSLSPTLVVSQALHYPISPYPHALLVITLILHYRNQTSSVKISADVRPYTLQCL